MAVETTITQEATDAAPVVSSSRTAWFVAGFAALALAHGPLLYWHLCSVLSKPHYQFIVLLPVAIGALVWQRWDEMTDLRRGRLLFSYVFGVLALGTLGLATRLWSPWLGAVAAMLTVLGTIYVLGGWRLVTHLLPAWLMLWFAVALPLDLDGLLIQSLRGYATAWTGAVLDWIGIRHLIEGNVIHVPRKAFFVADACTGIHSLFVVAAMAMFLGFWNRRRPQQIAVLLLCAFGLVLIENVSRLVAVVAIFDWGVDISGGWRHQALGGVVFVATLGLLLSADQLVSFAIPERLLFFWPWRPTAKPRARRDADLNFGAIAQLHWKPLLPLLGCFLAIGIWQVARAPAEAPQIAETLSNPFQPLEDLSADAMPPQIGDWIRKKHEFVKRDVEDPQGQFSHVWTYENQGHSVELSVDFPFPAIHDACLCFENTGWTILSQRMIEDSQAAAGIVEARMAKSLAGDGYLLSSFFNTRNEFGARVYPRNATGADDRLLSRLNSFVGQQTENQPPGTKVVSGPVAQLRLAANFHRSFEEDETNSIVDFYRTARLLLGSACRTQLRETP